MKRMKKRVERRAYPRYMLSKPLWHKIPPHTRLKDLMILRLMVKQKMPDDGRIDYDTMAANMRASHFFNGISVNLLYKFKKRDAVWWIEDDELTSYWDFSSKSPFIHPQILVYNAHPGYFGFRIREVENLRSTCEIYNDKQKLQRVDDVICKVEHWPTRVNFWHFNIFLYGIEKNADGTTKRIYCLSDELKEKKVAKVASNMMDDFYNILVTGKKLRARGMKSMLYRRGKEWNSYLSQLITKGVVRENDTSY